MEEQKLIEEVRKYQELYDTNHTNYMKSKLKSKIWSNIAKELNCKDGEEAKNVWLKLRASYRDSRRRHQKHLKSGSASHFIKPWKFQKQMAFLETFMSTREGKSTQDSDDDSHKISEPSMNESSTSLSQLDQEISIVKRPQLTSHDGCLTHIPVSKNELSTLLNRSIKQREERSRQRMEDRKKILEENKSMNDPMYNFFITMYLLTKKLPSHYQLIIRNQVFQIVSEAEVDAMNIPSRPSSEPD